jgi:DNA-binding NarL/FixJ family response regulator
MTDLDLPPVLAEVAEVAGVTAALQLAHAKGGSQAYIPKPENLTPDHWLVEAVGDIAARAIAERMGGGHCGIPLGPLNGMRSKVWRAIQEGIKEGKSAHEIARLIGVHHRTVRRHRNGHSGIGSDDPSQGKLF